MTAIYLLPTWSKIIALLLIGAAPGYEPGSRMTFEGKDG